MVCDAKAISLLATARVQVSATSAAYVVVCSDDNEVSARFGWIA
jgi:hypothetical protein